jgi:SNF2 family DNA or RNA helicase
MNIKLNDKIIQDMCGTVSFKRGETYFRTNKVKIETDNEQQYKAIVNAGEQFHVVIQQNPDGNLQTECSCPKLASFDLSCQHVAAALIAIKQIQQTSGSDLTEDFFTLFNQRISRSSGEQRHFETREAVDTEFICKPVSIGGGENLIGIQLKINNHSIEDIRSFLKLLKQGRPFKITENFIYTTKDYCFKKDADAIIRELIKVLLDEQIYTEELTGQVNTVDSTILLPPTSWKDIFPLLLEAPGVRVEYLGETFPGIQRSLSALPLTFEFDETGDKRFTLSISGFSQMIIAKPYHSVLYEGKIVELNETDCSRLAELKTMLGASSTNEITIPNDKITFFLEKVAPHLKKLGKVRISKTLSDQYIKTPLVAKLYLDRVNNKLLAGIEFQYDHFVFNPLEERESPIGSLVVRDIEKEDEILGIMESSSFARTEGGYFLHNEELEFDFLYYQMPELQRSVRIYATTAVRNRIFRKDTKPQIRVKVKRERTNWLEFKFDMEGIAEKDIHELLSALEEKRKYFRLRNGSLMSLETKEAQEIQRFLARAEVNSESLANGLDLPMNQCLELLDNVDGSNGFRIEKSFREFLDTLRHPARLKFKIPVKLDPILRDYQKKGFQWMKMIAHYGFGGILADDMGLGKTLQSITFIQSILEEIRRDQTPALIICPSSLTYNWLSEFAKFTPDIESVVMDGSKSNRTRLQSGLSGVDVIITSYPIVRRDIHWFEKQYFAAAFFDEAQAFKNPVTQTARAVKKIKANHHFALSGTPIENSIEELWSIFHIVFPQLFMGLKEYSQLTSNTIARRIQPFLLRRVKEDVLGELPDKIISRETIELLPEQKKLYAAYLAKLRHDTLKHIDKDTLRKNKIKILAGITRLRQLCCHPGLFVDGYDGRSAKLEHLMDIMEESMHSGRRVLIFSQFTKMLQFIARELTEKDTPFFYLDGDTPSENRLELCNRYNRGERDVFLISLKAGGTGLNLHSADTVILYDTWWNPAVEEQAADRAHRMGQENVVQVIKLVARGTIEEKMNELQDKKRDLIEEMIDSTGKKNTPLSEDDIREILML